MKSIQQIKTDLMMYLSYRLHYRYVATESINNSDVFGINKSDYSVEFEIKTNRVDLVRELNYIFPDVKTKILIKEALGRCDNKIIKHIAYAKKTPIYEFQNWYGSHTNKYQVPNKYYFVIPEPLFKSLYFRIVDLPYGIMTFKTDGDYNWWQFETKKKPDFLHNEKATSEIKERMLDRVVNELVELRDKYYNKTNNEKLS